MSSHADGAETSGGQARPVHDIPSLDSLRAVSIAMVIASHASWFLPHAIVASGLFRYTIGGGLHGVQIFFVISGYLITTLLVREHQRSGSIRLGRFYARRALRIFPPFYAYLAVLATLWALRVLPENGFTFAAAATYVLAWVPHPHALPVEHAWSLSIEEQFYLLWPPLLFWCLRRERSLGFALAILAAMPLLRTLALALHMTSHGLVMLGAVDTLMAGCLLALLRGQPAWERRHRQWVNAWSALASIVLGFVLIPYSAAKWTTPAGSLVVTALDATLTAACIAVLVVYAVDHARSLPGRILNSALFRHLGLISYGIYLWQQLFTLEVPRMLPLGFAGMLAAAELSYWGLERPLMRMRARLR
jgi:peptidoglycan/LPS O-acetylase OafA/YrhL